HARGAAGRQDQVHGPLVATQRDRRGTGCVRRLARQHAPGLDRHAGSARNVLGDGQGLSLLQTTSRGVPAMTTATDIRDEFTISHVFDLPRDLVWKGWTEPAHLAHWRCPDGVQLGLVAHDVRLGGCVQFEVPTARDRGVYILYTYQKIVPEQRLEFTTAFCDAKRNVTRAPFNPKFPLVLANWVTFSEQNGRTVLEGRGHPVGATDEERETFAGMAEWYSQACAASSRYLADYLKAL